MKENREDNETIISFPGFSLTSFTRAGILSHFLIYVTGVFYDGYNTSVISNAQGVNISTILV